MQILQKMHSDTQIFNSVNSVDINDNHDNHQLSVKFLQSLTFFKLLSAQLCLKIRSLIILL